MRLQERIDTLETEARGRLRRAFETGNEKLMEFDRALARVAKDDWSVPAMRRHVEELRRRAERARSSALKRAGELPAEAVTKLVNGTRTPVQSLAKGLAEVAKRFEPPAKPSPVEVKPAETPSEPKVAKVG